jgi:hypothetical protein
MILLLQYKKGNALIDVATKVRRSSDRVRRSSDKGASACFTAGPGSIPVPAPLVKVYWSGLHRLRLMLENCMSQLKTNKLKRVTDATKPSKKDVATIL